MGWGSPNVYYSPEKFGLTTVGEIDWTEPNYSFDRTVVWVNDKKKLFWAYDSGCSCPTPFDDLGLNDLSTGGITALKSHLMAEFNERDHYYGGASLTDVQDLLALARKAVAR